MHWPLLSERVQAISGLVISTPSSSLAKSTADRMARYVSLLQHLGPPTSPMEPSALEVILLESPQESSDIGVAPVAIETNIPALIPAPQAPQNPHAPPGMAMPLLIISGRASDRSTSPPALR